MHDKTNACGDRIVYDRSEDAAEWQQEQYLNALKDVEDCLAIISKIQESRKNEAGDISEPLTKTELNTILEQKRLYLDSALAVLEVMECSEGQYR